MKFAKDKKNIKKNMESEKATFPALKNFWWLQKKMKKCSCPKKQI
ncbi:MAG: hypothetical protein CM15mP93_01110 [Thiotrichaceae bacterium]|nr:MAG: hypothetical protein CM15mP93_01110 [Thiotrichaceae bacterium]